jgi:hypothetical protein
MAGTRASVLRCTSMHRGILESVRAGTDRVIEGGTALRQTRVGPGGDDRVAILSTGVEDAVTVVPVRSARERFVLVLVDLVALTIAVTGAAILAMAAIMAAIGVAMVAVAHRLQAHG